ncbi:lytic polysaccharide monooxygenase [Xylariaceae sp. FL0016]|nr:lytic polysaccharide monooxygenase [Xylariaceae sp. FL0016]
MKSFHLPLFGLVGLAQSHTLFTTLYINDESQGSGTCVRESTNLVHPTDPVVDLASTDMVCGVGGLAPVNFTCTAPAGAKLTFEYREIADTAGSGFIDESHKGPAAVYAKRISDSGAIAESGEGPDWFKIWGEGYDADADLWATEKLIQDDGLLSVQIPSALPAGNYLFRPEVVAMHNTTPEVQPQFYVGCAQVCVESSVTASLDIPADMSVSIPGYLQPGDKSVTYNIYDEEEYADPKVPYPQMGPDVYAPAAVSSASKGSVVTQSSGGIPDKCLLVNANWCGVEVSAYSNSTGCWASVQECWDQNQACWDEAPPSGGRNCKVWEGKCKAMDSSCSASDFSGPPDYELSSNDWPAPSSIPAAMNAGEESTAAASASTSGAVTATPAVEAVSATGTEAAGMAIEYPSAGSNSVSAVTSTASLTGVASSSPETATPTQHCGSRKHKRRHARQVR